MSTDLRFRILTAIALFLLPGGLAHADEPTASYIFPAGAQRGTEVEVRVGGLYLHEKCPFEMTGPGVTASPEIERIETIWFEGPVIPQPASQRKEDYPKDYRGQIEVAESAPLGNRTWRVRSSQGISNSLRFVIGDLPEIVEQEVDGAPIPTAVALPLTINGRIFPREDVDIWTFNARAGQTITAEVSAARLGSPLDARLEIRDADGRRLAENDDTFANDPRLQFAIPADGEYAVYIFDAEFGGLQDHVYRLTLTTGPYVRAVFPLGGRRGSSLSVELDGVNLPSATHQIPLPDETTTEFTHRPVIAGETTFHAVTLDVDDLPEVLESDSTGNAGNALQVPLPGAANGRIMQPGEEDAWQFQATKGQRIRCEVLAQRLGSPLDARLTLHDSTGRQLAQADDQGTGTTDPVLTASIPVDGQYTLRIAERFSSRGGRGFAYRIKLRAAEESAGPDFGIEFPAEVINLTRGGEFKLRVNIDRSGGYKGPIELALDPMPQGITASGTTVGKNRTNTNLVLTADEAAPLTQQKICIIGRATEEGVTLERSATGPHMPGEAAPTEFPLAVTVGTPFRFYGIFESKFAPRGSVYVRHYHIERNGFDGPLEISLADAQARHLQGVTGPKIIVPPGQDEFDYPISMPPWMQIGRTSRTCLMAVGVVEEPDGSRHKVSYSSQEQADQIITLVDPGRLSVRLEQSSLALAPGTAQKVAVQIGRANELAGPVSVEVVIPRHIRGIESSTVEVPADADSALIPLRFAAEDCGPLNQPLVIRATMADNDGNPVTANASLTLVEP